MRWEGQRESGNVEDRRGMGPARIGGGLGIGGIVLVLAVSYFTGINPLTLLNMLNGVQSMPESIGALRAGADRIAQRPTGEIRRGGPRRHGNYLETTPWATV